MVHLSVEHEPITLTSEDSFTLWDLVVSRKQKWENKTQSGKYIHKKI